MIIVAFHDSRLQDLSGARSDEEGDICGALDAAILLQEALLGRSIQNGGMRAVGHIGLSSLDQPPQQLCNQSILQQHRPNLVPRSMYGHIDLPAAQSNEAPLQYSSNTTFWASIYKLTPRLAQSSFVYVARKEAVGSTSALHRHVGQVCMASQPL